MARFPSIKTLVTESLFTFNRFTLCLISAIVGSIAGIYLVHIENHYYHEAQAKNIGYLIMVCSLGLTLFFSISLFAERKQLAKSRFILLNAIAIALLSGYYFFLRNCFNDTELTRYILLNIALHLLASFAGFTNKNNVTGFWQFNKALFLRLFISMIFSFTLYLGIALALLAIDQLFNIKIDYKLYFNFWIVIAGVFNTWFFLSGVPKNLDELEHSDDYPKGLKIFTQYVLLPLVTLYLLILYAYTFKIIFAQHLPKGWVSYLVVGFSILGVLALLLVHPIRNREGNKWIHVFSKWFYGALYPLVILLFVAIGVRIDEYGITEKRYFIIVLAIWLAGVSTYFLFSKKANIKYIPITLCAIALACSFGPWSAFNIAQNSQMHILEKVLVKNNILKDGKIDTKHKPVADSVAQQITSIVRYFDEMHGFNSFKPWFKQNIDSLISDTLRYQRVDNILKLMEIPYTNNYHYDDERDNNGDSYKYFNYNATDREEVKEITGYDYEFDFNASVYGYAYDKGNVVKGDSIRFNVSKDSSSIEIKKNSKLIYTFTVAKLINQWNDSIKSNYNGYCAIPASLMEQQVEDSTYKIKLQFSGIYGTKNKERYRIQSANGNCLIKLK